MSAVLEPARQRPRGRLLDTVESKLDPPAVRPGIVARAALVERLCVTRTASVVELVAPAGYGKTTLLSQWADRDRRPFAWVSADEGDNDPRLLLAYIGAALDRIEPLDPRIFEAPARRGRPSWRSIASGLGAAISAMPPLVIVVDDVQVLREPACLEALELLVERLGKGSALALAGRSPLLPPARLRAEGRLFEISARELRLDETEAGALLRGAGVDVTGAETVDLARRTEGWPAGLFLAALALREGRIEAGAGAFGGDDRFVTDYLRLEVLDRLDADDLEFVTRAAVLEQLSGPLCDAVLERTNSAGTLERLERLNAFLVPLDHRRQWYRFHRLFRDLLRGELERREPTLVPELNRRAAEWCAAGGAPESAIGYADAAGDLDLVANLVGVLGLPLCDSGKIAVVEGWLDRLDADGGPERCARAAVAGAWVHALAGRDDDTERWACAAAADGAPAAALLRAARCRDGVERMRRDAVLAADGLAADRTWAPAASLVLGASHLLAGELFSADGAFAAASGATIAGCIALAERSLLAAERGDLGRAATLAQEARGLVEEGGLGDCPAVSVVYAASACSAVRRGESAKARKDLAAARRLGARLMHSLPWLALQVRIELIRAHVSLADFAEARALMLEADELVRRHSDLGAFTRQAGELRETVDVLRGPSAGWASTLTDAELRLLPLLTTYLSFREIADRLFVSRNTVKTQAVSMYRKLGVSSRGEALERAAALGLVSRAALPPAQGLAASGKTP